MKRLKTMRRSERLLIPASAYAGVFVLLTGLLFSIFAQAQTTQLTQVKTFDQQLQPLKGIELSVNGQEFFATNAKGVVFMEFGDKELPVKTIRLKDDQLEAASWNYSKGTLEIVIRKKNYKLISVMVRNVDGVMQSGLTVTFNGKKSTTATTNAEGKIELPLALDEKLGGANQFVVNGKEVVKLEGNILTVDRIKTPVAVKENPVASTTTPQQEFKNFNLANLDSIQSLTVFYAVFKNLQIKNLDEKTKRLVDAKFNELVAQMQESGQGDENSILGKISDSSFVAEDIKNLLNKATSENQTLEAQRLDFDEKIKIINQKLERGILNMDAQTRSNLLSDLALLEQMLIDNERRFYKNQNDYRTIISNLKEKYFDIRTLGDQLSESEAKRLEEQRIFRQRLIGISAVVILFLILTILLVTLSSRLRKQKMELVRVNGEINRMNENLEGIVKERTQELEEANRELDTFLYRASHDLRSPICSIIGLCNIALQLSDGESKDLVRRVAFTTEGMDKLLKKLSIISEINQPTNYSSISLKEVANAVVNKFRKTIQDRHVDFSLDCPDDITFYSYPNLVEVVLSNLLENALFYSSMNNPSPRVELKARLKNDALEITVNDNGIGVDATIRHRLFDMFFKGHIESKGSGLGLYIVNKSVQALDGKISVESDPGKLTRFVVVLPIQPEPKEVLEVA